jgi:hypothetical protein
MFICSDVEAEAEATENMPLPLPLCFKVAVQTLVELEVIFVIFCMIFL